MTVDASRPVVGSAYVLIVAHGRASGVEGEHVNRRAVIKNSTSTAGIYLGGPDDPANQRFLWEPADGPLALDLEPGEELWGVSAGVDQTVHVLVNGR